MNSYKERNPLKTIEIIYNFFTNNKNFKIKIAQNVYNTESKTYWCAIELYYKNQIYLCSNGKGTTEELCLASGFGELFERFCSQKNIYDSYAACLKLQESKNKLQIKDYNLFLDYKFINDFLEKNKINSLKDTLLMFDDFLFVENFFSLDSNYNIKLPIGLIYKIFGTTGLSAGNTLEESLVQGLSELCERYALQQMFIQDNIKYHQIPIEAIQNINNIKIISQILENKNNSLLFFDLSYNFNLPVCLIALINKINKKINFKLGSFPDFDIAIERCLTELYQGNYNTFDSISFPMVPLRNNNNIYSEIVRTGIGLDKNLSFPEHILFNNIIEKTPNFSIFLSHKNNTNKDFLEYYKKLFTNNNIEIFWRQTSPKDFKDMYATQVLSPNLIGSNTDLYFSPLPLREKERMYYESCEMKQNIKNILINNYLEININKICNFNYQLLNYIFVADPLSIYPNRQPNVFSIISNIYNNINIPFQILQNKKYNKILDLYIILQYLKNNNYNQNEIDYMANILDINNNIYIKNKNQINCELFEEYKNDYNNFEISDFLV